VLGLFRGVGNRCKSRLKVSIWNPINHEIRLTESGEYHVDEKPLEIYISQILILEFKNYGYENGESNLELYRLIDWY
jgi:hypothetical protein